jgi:hypothetical protein
LGGGASQATITQATAEMRATHSEGIAALVQLARDMLFTFRSSGHEMAATSMAFELISAGFSSLNYLLADLLPLQQHIKKVLDVDPGHVNAAALQELLNRLIALEVNPSQ